MLFVSDFSKIKNFLTRIVIGFVIGASMIIPGLSGGTAAILFGVFYQIMEAVNNIFPYIQLPLRFKETPAHGELYVYEKKKTLKPSDSLSSLLHLELEALGTMDIFVTLAGAHVTTRFSMTDKESGNFIQTELPKLSEALAAKGYILQSEVTIRKPEEENTPTLLEQFLEEHAPGGLNRYTFDIRA